MSAPHLVSGQGPTDGVTYGPSMITRGIGPWGFTALKIGDVWWWGINNAAQLRRRSDYEDGGVTVIGLFTSLSPIPPGGDQTADSGWRKVNTAGGGDGKDRMWVRSGVSWAAGTPDIQGTVTLESDGAGNDWGGGLVEHDGGKIVDGQKIYTQTAARAVVATAEDDGDGGMIFNQLLPMNLLMELLAGVGKSNDDDDPQPIAVWRMKPDAS